MKNKERLIILIALLAIVIFLLADLRDDFIHGGGILHLGFEALMALIALSGVFIILRGSFKLKKNLEQTQIKLVAQEEATDEWRKRAQIHITGLSAEIARQLNDWGLSAAEKEIAFMLLKGLSLREIANIRGTNEKTTRAQATIIYQKSGLSGRADLSAFFLEDLLG